jgi:hypothetical protein
MGFFDVLAGKENPVDFLANSAVKGVKVGAGVGKMKNALQDDYDVETHVWRFQMMKKAAGILLFSTVLTVFVFSADFPSPIQKGDVLINGGFGIGLYSLFDFPDESRNTVWYGDPALLGGYLSVDYVLPIGFPLTIGGEIGFSGAGIESPASGWPKGSFTFIPILARVAWHPDFGAKNLDPYLMFKLGYGFGGFGGAFDDVFNPTNPSGLGVGIDIGIRYFFTDHLGMFAEGGYETFFADFDSKTGTIPTGPSSSVSYDVSWVTYVQRFFTIGVTYKL